MPAVAKMFRYSCSHLVKRAEAWNSAGYRRVDTADHAIGSLGKLIS